MKTFTPKPIRPKTFGLQTTNLSLHMKWSEYKDSNLGPPAPKAGALTRLRYTPKNWCPHYDSNAGPTDYKSVALPTEL